MRAGVKTPATITSCHSDEAWDGGENGPTRETCRFGAPALFPPARPVGRSPPFSLGLAFGCAPERKLIIAGGKRAPIGPRCGCALRSAQFAPCRAPLLCPSCPPPWVTGATENGEIAPINAPLHLRMRLWRPLCPSARLCAAAQLRGVGLRPNAPSCPPCAPCGWLRVGIPSPCRGRRHGRRASLPGFAVRRGCRLAAVVAACSACGAPPLGGALLCLPPFPCGLCPRL